MSRRRAAAQQSGQSLAMDLVRTFEASQYASALEAWKWVGVADRQPVFASPFGDLFLEDAEGIWFLDVIGGHLTMEWPDRAALDAELETQDGRERWLTASLAEAAFERSPLADGQVYDFVQNPVLGGAMDVCNLAATDFEVAIDIAGQIHQQVAPLAAGTRVSGAALIKLPMRTTAPDNQPKRRRFGRR